MPDRLSQVEKRVFRAYWDDGLLDAFAALGVLSIGVLWLFDLHLGGAIVPVVLVSLWAPIREKLIEPRLGSVEFSDARENRSRRLLWLAIVAGAAAFVAAVSVYLLHRGNAAYLDIDWIAALPALLLAMMAALGAILISAPRFLVHTAVLVLVAIIGAINGWEPGSTLAVAGALMAIIAGYLLSRFFRSHPR